MTLDTASREIRCAIFDLVEGLSWTDSDRQ